ncbi:MAG: peptidoglycan-binding domain-containing protein [Actinomycetes bacterium]
MSVLKRGSRGPLVQQLKRRLRAHGHWRQAWGYTTGFGRITDQQVRIFQAKAGLIVDGQVGPQTWAALNAPAFNASKGERARAVNWALSKQGITERPAGSNQGPGRDGITAIQEAAGYPGGGVPYCQCFASYSAQVGSRGRLRANTFGGYTVAVVDMARNGSHGLRLGTLRSARPGDWIEFNFPGGESVDHVGVFLRHDSAAGTVTCIEANTSAPGDTTGSQANGQGIWTRTRSVQAVGAVVVIPFKS